MISGYLSPRNARSEVADGGTACNMEGSYEYIELAVAESRKGVVPPAWDFGRRADDSSP